LALHTLFLFHFCHPSYLCCLWLPSFLPYCSLELFSCPPVSAHPINDKDHKQARKDHSEEGFFPPHFCHQWKFIDWLIFFIVVLGWGYIAAFTKVLTIYQRYLNLPHLPLSFIPPPKKAFYWS
jgi:hypothetical protein